MRLFTDSSRKQMENPDWEKWQELIRQQAAAMGLSITPAQTRLFAVHAAELLRWNAKINLTAITDPAEAAVKHFLDSLAPSLYIPGNSSLLDIGTGGGFPGIPLKVANPSLAVTLVDATLKKINFVRQVIRLLALDNTTAIHSRAELLEKDPAFRQAFDTVICRAFDSLPDFVSIAGRLVRPGGRLIAMKGKQAEAEVSSLNSLELTVNDRQTDVRSLFTIDVHPYALPVLGDQRSLIILTAK
jgi:16S rRNA (guanine527-N7)-methyltransferase